MDRWSAGVSCRRRSSGSSPVENGFSVIDRRHPLLPHGPPRLHFGHHRRDPSGEMRDRGSRGAEALDIVEAADPRGRALCRHRSGSPARLRTPRNRRQRSGSVSRSGPPCRAVSAGSPRDAVADDHAAPLPRAGTNARATSSRVSSSAPMMSSTSAPVIVKGGLSWI